MRLLSTFVGAGLLAAGAFAPGGEPLTITRHYTPADRERDRYMYVPFEVAEGTTELRIKYAYDRAAGQNTIDLGVFEPGSLELHTTAMRGYSGGSKSEVTIGECESSPGYEAGPLPPGRWHVMLGLYQVAPEGVEVTVSVGTGRAGCAPAPAPGPRTFRDDGPRPTRWWSGALHAHTVHSDGAESPVDVLRRVREAGLDFVAITDHNNITHVPEIVRLGRDQDERPLWIVGEEITTPAGHANVWGVRGEWIDFRVRPHERRIGELVAAAHRQQAVFSINHPVGECAGCSWEHEIPPGVHAMEVWNGPRGPQDGAVEIWERLLREGRRVTAVGASDWHRDPAPIDAPNVRVQTDRLNGPDIFDAIRSGRVIVTRTSRDLIPDFFVRSAGESATVGGTLTIADSSSIIDIHAPGLTGGRAVVVLNGTRLPPVPLPAGARVRLQQALAPGYIRLETYDANGEMVAFTNPVFLMR